MFQNLDGKNRTTLAFEEHSGRIISGVGPLAKVALRFARWHFFWTIKRNVRKGSSVLEFGSGGGDAWLANNYLTAGIELSFRSAVASSQLYRHVLNADISRIPLRSESFDAAVSSFVLEHLTLSTASLACYELHRILRPGGFLVCLCDLECNHPLLSRMRKKFPVRFHETFVDAQGHIGLRTEKEWLKLLRKTGFEIKQWHLMSRFPLLDHGPMSYLVSGKESSRKAVSAKNRVLGFLLRSKVYRFWSIAVVILDDIFRHLLPRSWAYRLLFVAHKRRT